MRLEFSTVEVRDLAVAWVALGVAFTFFLNPAFVGGLSQGRPPALATFLAEFALSMLTVGVGFLLHELAHKVVAVRFGQVAEFRADFGMLFIAVVGGLAGFLFAAPGAVHHRGRITTRENGLIALAGPVTNVVLAIAFLPLLLAGGGFVGQVGGLGVAINVLLAGFNMIPFGPLDGRKVLDWNKFVFAVTFVPTAGLALLIFL